MILFSLLALGFIFLFAPKTAIILGVIAIVGKVIFESIRDPSEKPEKFDISYRGDKTEKRSRFRMKRKRPILEGLIFLGNCECIEKYG